LGTQKYYSTVEVTVEEGSKKTWFLKDSEGKVGGKQVWQCKRDKQYGRKRCYFSTFEGAPVEEQLELSFC